jgi:hypothetical protein
LSWNTSKKVGRKIRAITKGRRKMDSAAKTMRTILEKEARELLEDWIIVWYWFPPQYKHSFTNTNY